MHFIDLHTFRFVTGSWTWASLTLGRTLLPQTLFCIPLTWEVWEGRLPLKTKGRKLLSRSALSLSSVSSFPALITGGVYIFLDLPFLADIPVEALPVLFIPCQIQVQLLDLPHSVSPTFVSIRFPGYLLLLHAFSSSWLLSLYRQPFLSKSEL